MLYDAKNLQCYSRNNFTPFMYLLLLGQAASFMHCCDTVLFQRFMHLKACNGYGLNVVPWLPAKSVGKGGRSLVAHNIMDLVENQLPRTTAWAILHIWHAIVYAVLAFIHF